MGALEWSAQIVLVALLAAALPLVVRLERSLRAARRDREALGAAAAGLGEATRMAEAASVRLRASAEASGRQVAERLAAAEPLRDDLRYLVERAEALADRLDGLVRTARVASGPGAPGALPADRGRSAVPTAAGGAAPAGAPAAGRSRAERELLRALISAGAQPGATGR